MEYKPERVKGSLFPPQEFESEDDESWQISYLDIITIVLGFLIILLSVSQITKIEFTSLSSLFAQKDNETEFITTPINHIQEDLVELLQPEIEAGHLEIIRDLNDIRIRFRSDYLYKSGEAILQPEAKELLNRVLIALMQLDYSDFQIDVEGHTDNTPIATSKYPSNWELSTARASNIVRYFNEMGISSKRLKASGYADSRPVILYDSLGFPFSAPKEINRRVVLRLYYDAENLKQNLAESTSPTDSATQANQLLAENLNPFTEDQSPIPDTLVSSLLPDVTESEQKNDTATRPEPPLEPEPSPPLATAQKEEPIHNQTQETPAPEPKKEVAHSEQKTEESTTQKTIPNLLKVDQRCVYSVEVDAPEELAQSFIQIKKLEEATGLTLELMYNNSQYSIRTPVNSSLFEAIKMQQELSFILSKPEIGVLHQCYNNTYERPRPIKYQIQFGAFQDRNNGLRYTMDLTDKYNIQAFMARVGDSYKVLMGPFDTYEEVQAKVQSLRQKGVQTSIFINHQPESISDYKYAYQIQVNVTPNRTEAEQLATQISSRTKINTRVVELIPGSYSVMTGQSHSRETTQRIFNQLRNSSFDVQPVIFILEYI